MISNPDYDLAKPIQSAIKSKAPYVGVPMPGHAPLIFKRSLLAGALKGVKPIHIEVTNHENGLRTLTIEGTCGPRVRTRCTLYSIHRKEFGNWNSEVRKAMDKWKPTLAPAKSKAPKQTKFDKAIIVLEKKLVKLGDRPRLANPAIAEGHPSHDRESCLKWYAQKSLRGQVGSLGKRTRKGELDSRQFYAAMDTLPGIGKVTRYSELDTRQKESIQRDIRDRLGRNGFFDYANPTMLWRFMPTLKTWQGGKPYSLRPIDKEDVHWGVERYYPVLNWQRERAEILAAIESISDMQQQSKIVSITPERVAPTFEEFIQRMAA